MTATPEQGNKWHDFVITPSQVCINSEKGGVLEPPILELLGY